MSESNPKAKKKKAIGFVLDEECRRGHCRDGKKEEGRSITPESACARKAGEAKDMGE